MHIQDLFTLKGKTAIVTGGGRGLGRYIALGLAEAGANVVVCSRKVASLERAADEIRGLGVEAMALPCDVTKPDDVDRVFERTVERFGTVDVLVNNSGATWGSPALEMPLEAWRKVLDVNLTGTFLMSQRAGKLMMSKGGGKIINIASVAGLGGIDPRAMDAVGYNASKGAIITLTKDLAVKWGTYGIRVNAIAPGFFPTKMSQGLIEEHGQYLLDHTPLGRFGGEDDLKGIAVLLASPASNYMTGSIVVVDGGVSA
ncbi:MAG: SDR family oxidoreductase [Sulfobacillus sp.]